MSFYVDGSGYAQTGAAAAAFTYGTFQPTQSQQVIETGTGYGYGGGAVQGGEAAWQQMQATGHVGAHYQQMPVAAQATGHHVGHGVAAANYGPIGGHLVRQNAAMAVRGAHMAGGHRGAGKVFRCPALFELTNHNTSSSITS